MDPVITRRPPPAAPKNPQPESGDAKEGEAWAIAWQAHVYFSGTLFVLLAIYCGVNIARIHSFSRLVDYEMLPFVGHSEASFKRPTYLTLDIFPGCSAGVTSFA